MKTGFSMWGNSHKEIPFFITGNPVLIAGILFSLQGFPCEAPVLSCTGLRCYHDFWSFFIYIKIDNLAILWSDTSGISWKALFSSTEKTLLQNWMDFIWNFQDWRNSKNNRFRVNYSWKSQIIPKDSELNSQFWFTVINVSLLEKSVGAAAYVFSYSNCSVIQSKSLFKSPVVSYFYCIKCIKFHELYTA